MPPFTDVYNISNNQNRISLSFTPSAFPFPIISPLPHSLPSSLPPSPYLSPHKFLTPRNCDVFIISLLACFV